MRLNLALRKSPFRSCPTPSNIPSFEQPCYEFEEALETQGAMSSVQDPYYKFKENSLQLSDAEVPHGGGYGKKPINHKQGTFFRNERLKKQHRYLQIPFTRVHHCEFTIIHPEPYAT